MRKSYLVIAAILGALAVALGAFGAHGLQKVASEETVQIYQTGVKYQFYHVFALMAIGILSERFPGKLMSMSGLFCVIGIVLFSGSLYLITFMKIIGNGVSAGIGIITPLGGLFLIAAWILLFINLIVKKRPPRQGDNSSN